MHSSFVMELPVIRQVRRLLASSNEARVGREPARSLTGPRRGAGIQCGKARITRSGQRHYSPVISLITSSGYPDCGSCSRENSCCGSRINKISAVVRTMHPGDTCPPVTRPWASATLICKWLPVGESDPASVRISRSPRSSFGWSAPAMRICATVKLPIPCMTNAARMCWACNAAASAMRRSLPGARRKGRAVQGPGAGFFIGWATQGFVYLVCPVWRL
jgi:hypothetical protein